MKTLTIATLLIITATSTFGGENFPGKSKCDLEKEKAKAAMRYRQQNKTLEELIGKYPKLESYLVDAFNSPLIEKGNYEDYKNIVNNFSYKYENSCLGLVGAQYGR